MHLVVEQDYARYDEQDQAVWRFVVMQTHSRLLKTAHAAYGPGFEAVGIRPDRIARISEMNERLGELGWSAVCVDGFIPPRAFQAFQAASVLPIAADIRTSGHLTYTPAPDIIHEAAGHAPFLAEPSYARFLRRIGEVGRKAFASPHDQAMYEAIYTLSEVKEDPSSTPDTIARAEQAFAKLAKQSSSLSVSEAAKLARLYWWTVEYGLVGSVSSPKLYGAGLLSSIGEGHFCLSPEVQKLPLCAECVNVPYDITRAQPQLFVAEDFGALSDVLDDVTQGLSQTVGGLSGLRVAQESGELATLTLDCGLEVAGSVDQVLEQQGEPSLISLKNEVTVAEDGAVLSQVPRVQEMLLPLGYCEDGTPLCDLDTPAILRHVNHSGIFRLTTNSGITITGRIAQTIERSERVACLLLHDAYIRSSDAQLQQRTKLLPLVLATTIKSVSAGGPAGHEPPTQPSGQTVPKPHTLDEAQLEMLTLYQRALEAFNSLGGQKLSAACAAIIKRLDEAYPEDWLLRFNVLESLTKAGEDAALQGKLQHDLERLELRYAGREPIATGLAYVRALAQSTPAVQDTHDQEEHMQ